MATDPNKTVFISYRRSTSQELARSIFMHLKYNGYDVFFDVNTMDNGAFDDIILNQIGARTHFISIISKGAFERCVNEGDWVRREIEEALRLGRNVVPIIWEGCDFAHETGFLPAHIREDFRRFSGMPLTHFFFDPGMDILTTRFLKPPTHAVKLKTVSAGEQREVEQRKAQIETSPTRKSLELMPKPFAWCDIPAGQVTLTEIGGYLKEPTTFTVDTFEMSKYPITNAQFDVFVNHTDGYKNPAWWDFSDEARIWRINNPKPQSTGFAGDTMPRTNVTWYEAIAFCGWMSAHTGENITLPTEQQWQRAAQGDDEREFPWGNRFNTLLCNTEESGIGKTTPVTQYVGKGDSPFGVVDMSGNVFKWCLTEYESGNINPVGDNRCVMRGGAWGYNLDRARVSYRDNYHPYFRFNVIGFFVVCRP